MNYTYGSLEAKLEAAKKEIDAAITQAQAFRVDQNPIIKFDAIYFGGSWDKKVRITAPQRMDSYCEFRAWSGFDETNAEHIERCYTACLLYIDKASAEVEKWHEENVPLIEHNKAARQRISSYLALMGIPESYTTQERNKRSKNLEAISNPAGFLGDLERNCRISDNYESAKQTLANHKREAEEWKKRLLAAIETKKREKEKTDKQMRLLCKSMELAKEWSIEYSTNEELLVRVDSEAKKKYIRDEYCRQEEHTDCKECRDWWMDLEITGNVVDGFTSYEID